MASYPQVMVESAIRRTPMKVKIFNNYIPYDASVNEKNPNKLETNINEWINANPNIIIIDMKFSTTTFGDKGVSGSCMIQYKEKKKPAKLTAF